MVDYTGSPTRGGVDDKSGARHLLHVFPSFDVGGAQIRFAQLARLHGLRYRHSIVSLNGVVDMAGRLPAGITIRVIPGEFKKTSPLEGAAIARRILRSERPDVLVSYNWGAMDWCLAHWMNPACVHVHIEDGFGPEEVDARLLRRNLLRRVVLSARATTLVVPSHKLQMIARDEWKIARSRIQYLPNGIDCDRFSPKGGARSGSVVIGTVATLRREKNIGRLIELFSLAARTRAPGTLRLLIVGDGPERSSLESRARKSPAAEFISFAGARNDPETFLAQMDIFALTSDTEQMPLSVLEAMAMGLPVVSFAVGDLPFMVSPINVGMVSISPSDGKSFVQSIEMLADDASLRIEMGESNRKRAVAEYDEEVMATRYANLFG